MERFAMDALRAWKNRRNRKPLVMRGARQVGKTWLVRKLAETEFESLLEVNFEQTPGAAALFASNDPAKILPLLAAQFGQRVEPGRTLLFLDEVQAAPQVLLSLRYFYEKLPALHVVAAGSLLEFALADHSFSMPVGRIEYFFLDPMTFGEFLCASGREALWGFLRSWRGADDFPAPIHDDCMELLRPKAFAIRLWACSAAWRSCSARISSGVGCLGVSAGLTGFSFSPLSMATVSSRFWVMAGSACGALGTGTAAGAGAGIELTSVNS